MTALRLTLAAAALSLSASLAPAATLGGYTSFLAFGDSLSDPGNLYAATGNTFPPSPPYSAGRFSNGPVWAELLSARFAKKGLFSANFAYGGANAVPDGLDSIPDLPVQLGLAAANVPPLALGARPLVSLWFGANDIFNELDKSTNTLDGVIAVAEAAADAIGQAAMAIASTGITDILLVNLPDLGQIPRFALFDPADGPKATAAADAFNLRLAMLAASLEAGGANITWIDVHSLFDDLIADPTQFGLTNATTPCFIPFVSLCTPQQAQTLAFFDQSHPNDRVHAVIAQTAAAAIVPLPASVLMLGAGLAGLAALRRRRSA